jgi:hypothetical protein
MLIRVRGILLGEFIRPEPFSKVSLLGLYGMLPDVTIRVGNLQAPTTLGILIMCHGEPGMYTLQLMMNGPHGANILTGRSSVPVSEEGPVNVLFNFIAVTFPESGSYAMKVVVDGEEIYNEALIITEDKALLQLANAAAG